MNNDELFALKDRAADRFLKIPHVNAVGIGSRRKNGKPTGELVIKVYITRKKPAADVPLDELIPESFEGIPTDVEQMGPGETLALPPGVEHSQFKEDRTRFNPLRGGGSLAAEQGDEEGGTLGCLLRDKENGSTIYALTNFHVVQVGGKLSRSARISHPIAEVAPDPAFKTKFEPVFPIGIVTDGGEETIRDAAIARLDKGTPWIPYVEQIGYLRGHRDIELAELVTGLYPVRKRGIKTLLTGGRVDSISDITTDDGTRHKNSLLIRPEPIDTAPEKEVMFADLGDSGAVIVNDDNEVIGLLWGREAKGPGPTGGFGFGFQIGTVLKRFKEVDGLDLEVAISKSPDAITIGDARELQEVPFPAGVPEIPGPQEVKRGDHSYYRPLQGGMQILAKPMAADPNAGTLGCIVREEANPNIAYILTAHSVVSANGSVSPTSDTDVGQPNNKGSCSGCCSNTVGAFSRAAPSASSVPSASVPTAAIVKLKNDQKWLGEIMRIGVLAGSKTVTAADLGDPDSSVVWKAGVASRVTSGVIVRVPDSTTPLPNGVPPDAMLIQPHLDPLRENIPVHFSRFADRGAVVVNRLNLVVGVLYAEIPLPVDGKMLGHGIAAPIQAVLDSLKTQAGFAFEVFAPQKINDVQTVQLREALADADALGTLPEALPEAEPLGALPEVLEASPRFRALLEAGRRHEDEVRSLIDRNRRVATGWHRGGGPALVQAFTRVMRVPSATLPTSVNGMPITACLDRLYETFWRYGSAALRADLSRLRPQVPAMGGLTLDEIAAVLPVWSPSPEPS